MDGLLAYVLRITPGLAIIIVLFLLIPRKLLALRILTLIFGFILMRDAMTPEGFWSFGVTDPAVWLRFIDNSFILTVLGALSVLAAGLLLTLPELRSLVNWGNPQKLAALHRRTYRRRTRRSPLPAPWLGYPHCRTRWSGGNESASGTRVHGFCRELSR